RSVVELRTIGIQRDIVIYCTERELGQGECEKIAQFCNVEPRAGIEERDKSVSIYEVPLSLVNNRLDSLIVEKLNLKAQPLEIGDWEQILERIKHPNHDVSIAVVGKYIKHHDAYKSVYEALQHAGIALNCKVHARKVEAEDVENLGAEHALGAVDGLLVPGGFGYRGIG